MSDQKKSATYESALGWGILLCVFAALGYLIWWYFKIEIRSGIRWLRYGEMWVMSWFVGDDYEVMWKGQPVNYSELMNMAARIPADRIDGKLIDALSIVGLAPYLWIICLLSTLFGFWALFRGPGTEHRRHFDLNTLIKKQANIFPIISPFITFNPAKLPPRPPGAPVPAEMPIFAEALSPEEWIVFNEIPVNGKNLDEEIATRAFTKQLGPRWRGAKNLAPYRQILLAAFCLKASRKRADSDTMLARLAKCWSEKDGLKLSRDRKLLREARAVLANQALSSSVLRKCNEHAWENTAMVRGLMTARSEGGVLAPAQFVWLRAHDRALWYPLNNLGRQSFHMEAMGLMAHFKAEKMAQRPIPRPKVGDAVKSLVEFLNGGKMRALPQMDYSKSKKRGVKKLKTA
jgi:intracellular multiplication protein IcmP